MSAIQYILLGTILLFTNSLSAAGKEESESTCVPKQAFSLPSESTASEVAYMPSSHYQLLDNDITNAFKNTCSDNELAQEVFAKVLPCLKVNRIEGYKCAVSALAAKYGDRYNTLMPNAKILFATVRSIEAFFCW